jgi:hypothetical protein
MLQTLDSRREDHERTVAHFFLNPESDSYRSLLYRFWLRPSVKVTFITLANIPINGLLSSDEQILLHVLCRLEESFFAFWMNTWNGTRSDIPALRQVSLDIWADIYPGFTAAESYSTGLTSHTPLKEALYQRSHQNSITKSMRLKYAEELQADAERSGAVLDHAALTDIWRRSDVLTRAVRKHQNLEEVKALNQHRRDVQTPAKREAFNEARRQPRNDAYNSMDTDVKDFVNGRRRGHWNGPDGQGDRQRDEKRRSNYTEKADTINERRRGKAKAERERVAGLTAAERVSEEAAKQAKKKPRSAAQLQADTRRSEVLRGRPQGPKLVPKSLRIPSTAASASVAAPAILPAPTPLEHAHNTVKTVQVVDMQYHRQPLLLSVPEAESILKSKRPRTLPEQAYDERKRRRHRIPQMNHAMTTPIKSPEAGQAPPPMRDTSISSPPRRRLLPRRIMKESRVLTSAPELSESSDSVSDSDSESLGGFIVDDDVFD